MTLVATAAVRDAMIRHARRDRPLECCGLLLGSRRRVSHAVAMPNLEVSVSRYRIDDAAHIEMRRIVRRIAPPLSIVGVYHSHPAGDAAPSDRDVREAMYPDWVYMIVGLAPRRPVVRAFRIRDGRVRTLAVRWR